MFRQSGTTPLPSELYTTSSGGGGTSDVNIADVGGQPVITLPASDETSIIYNGSTALTPKFAVISASASGPTTLVAAVAAHQIRVINIVLIASGTVNVKFQSHVTPTDETGLLYLVANTGFAPGYDPTGHFQTITGEALDINLSAGVPVGGWLKYLEV